jgi:class 3 adenylate cyclase
MSATPVKRKLAAILAADAVGYSRMMGADEEGTLRVLAGHRIVIDEVIALHHGRIVGTAGDSVLAEFESAVEAVRCAVEIQDALKTRNELLREDKRMLFRIGVNLGDVMVSGDDVHGDGVNVAARLEGAADPGSVFISSSVYDQITGKLNLAFVDIGDRELKNIARPIHIYKLAGTAPAGAAAAATAPRRAAARGRAWVIGTGAAAAAAGLAAWVWLAPGRPTGELQSELERARADAAEAKRELELGRAAESQAKADAVLARARADAEAIRRRADAELARAKRGNDKPPALGATSAPSKIADSRRYDGEWALTRACERYLELPDQVVSGRVTVKGGEFAIYGGRPGQIGYFEARGRPTGDGGLVLTGTGISSVQRSLGKPYGVLFEGRLEAERFVLKGHLGGRPCMIVLARG